MSLGVSWGVSRGAGDGGPPHALGAAVGASPPSWLSGGEAPGGIQKQLKASQGLVVCSVPVCRSVCRSVCLAVSLSTWRSATLLPCVVFCRSVPHAHKTFHIDVLPVPSSSRFVKGPGAREVCRFLKNKTPCFGPKAGLPRKTYGFWRARFWSCFSKGLQNTCGCTPPPFGAPTGHFQGPDKHSCTS